MSHDIMNQHGKHIIDDYAIVEINHALDHSLTHTYIEGRKIDIVSDKKTDKKRITIVKVEGI